ncbi:hypothetical protein HB943_09010 [Listeria weihenstephanensis]|uniref:Uncharacterized protein n=1 Tax=Listeria weihenstephanensis TaxID=1006155 RepID=A0A841Z8T9_9LIST|nr:hypothetical protein [Listeria weihenstephanensis]MBC1500743.1 hypothetical protein [Listeria weihenstephanensis]
MRKIIAAGLIFIAIIFIGMAWFSYSKKEEIRNRSQQVRQDLYRKVNDEMKLRQFPIQRLFR